MTKAIIIQKIKRDCASAITYLSEKMIYVAKMIMITTTSMAATITFESRVIMSV